MGNLFSKVIKEKQFNFQPFEFGEQSGYHVDVKDDEGTRWEFRMLKESEQWKLEAEKLPEWIREIQSSLADAIVEHD
jgi:hypothetical protein